MAVEIGDGGLGRIYLGDILIAGKPVTPPEDTTSVTVSWTENSNGNFNPQYGGDATGWTVGSNCWDKFFGYSAVLLGTDGQEKCEVTQEMSGGWGCLNINCLGSSALSGNHNVMIKYPRVGWCLSKSGSTITMGLTRCSNKAGYCYFAFNRGGPTDGRYCDTYTQPNMYLGTYLSSINSNVEKSRSGKTPDFSKNIDTFRSYSMANGDNYQQLGYWQRNLINLYYLAKYGCGNSQAAVGCGYVNGSCRVSTGGTNSQTSATYGTSSSTQQIKLFGLEDWRGNEYQWVDGIYGRFVETSNTPDCICNRIACTCRTWVDSGVSDASKSGWICGIAGTNLGLTTPTCFGGGYQCGYADCGYVYACYVAFAGGAWYPSCYAGAFLLYVYSSPAGADSSIGSRLMYL